METIKTLADAIGDKMSQDRGSVVHLTPGTALGKTEPMVSHKGEAWPSDPEDVPVAAWDSGVFITELMNLEMLPHKIQIANLPEKEQKAIRANPEALLATASTIRPQPIEEGTWRGTQLALTKVYDMIESKLADPLAAQASADNF